jgi:hypothetical protein
MIILYRKIDDFKKKKKEIIDLKEMTNLWD